MSNSIFSFGGANIADIKNTSGTEYTGWEEVYSIDFSKAGNSGDLDTGDTYVINGITWQANKDYGTVEVKSGTGLILTPAASSDFWSGGPQVPFLSASVPEMIPDLNQNDVLCMQWVVDFSASSGEQYPQNNYEAGGGCFWNGLHAGTALHVGSRLIGIGGQPYWGSFLGLTNQSNISLSGYSNPRYFTWENVLYIGGQTGIVSSGQSGSTTLEPPLEMKGTFSDGKRTRMHMWAPYGSYTIPGSWRTDEEDISQALTTSSLGVMFYGMEVYHTRTFKVIFKDFRLFRSRKP